MLIVRRYKSPDPLVRLHNEQDHHREKNDGNFNFFNISHVVAYTKCSYYTYLLQPIIVSFFLCISCRFLMPHIREHGDTVAKRQLKKFVRRIETMILSYWHSIG
jgi:hypothetical protein